MSQFNKSLTVFIHGIGANKESWDQFIAVLTRDKDVNIQENNIGKFDLKCQKHYYLHEYDSPIRNKDWFPWFKEKKTGESNPANKTIDAHAGDIRTLLNAKQSDYDEINLVAHSMGGLITLELLFNLFEDKNDTKLLKKVNKIVFFASPLAGSDDANEIKKFFDNYTLTKSFFSYAVKELSSNSITITSLQNGIKKHQKKLRELNPLYIYASSDSRILADSVKIANNFSFVETIEAGHSKIKEPTNQNDLAYCIFKDYIFVNKQTKEQLSIKKVEKHWEEMKKSDPKHSSHIVIESNYIHTIFANGIYICHHKYKMKMMERGKLDFFHMLIPFDKTIEDPIENDPFYTNNPGDRFRAKSYKSRFHPKTLPITKKKPIKYFDENSGKTWLKFIFESEEIEKGTEFTIEFSFSDKIDISDSEKAKERREQYFESTIDNIKRPHGIRHNTYQIESYTDEPTANVHLPFEPSLYADGNNIPNNGNCNENIYYKSWKWDFYYADKNPEILKIKLLDGERLTKNGPECM